MWFSSSLLWPSWFDDISALLCLSELIRSQMVTFHVHWSDWLHQRPAGLSQAGPMSSSESLTFRLRASLRGVGLRGTGHVDVEHLLVDGGRRAGRASHSRVWARGRVWLVPGWVLLLCPVQRNFESGSTSWGGSPVGLRLETLQLDGVFCVTSARQQDGHVFAELRAQSKVDEGVVETGRLGEEAGEDAGEVGHMEAPGRPHGHHGIRRPRQDEGRTDHYGNLEEIIDYWTNKKICIIPQTSLSSKSRTQVCPPPASPASITELLLWCALSTSQWISKPS